MGRATARGCHRCDTRGLWPSLIPPLSVGGCASPFRFLYLTVVADPAGILAESAGVEPARPEGLAALALRCLAARPTLLSRRVATHDGVHGAIRTRNLGHRKPPLWSVELRGRWVPSAGLEPARTRGRSSALCPLSYEGVCGSLHSGREPIVCRCLDENGVAGGARTRMSALCRRGRIRSGHRNELACLASRTGSLSTSFRGAAKPRARNPTRRRRWIPGSGLRPAPGMTAACWSGWVDSNHRSSASKADGDGQTPLHPVRCFPPRPHPGTAPGLVRFAG
jgi:hypothetical protein